MKRLCAGATAGIMLAAAMWVGGGAVALADHQSDRDALCGTAATDTCSITIRDDDFELTENKDRATIDVVGEPNVTAALQMFTVRPSETPMVWEQIKSWGAPESFSTDATGKATVRVPIGALSAPWTAGSFVAFQLAGALLVDFNTQPIEAADGDGLPDLVFVRSARGADATPSQVVTDGLLVMDVAGGLTGDVYGVQLKVKGTWRDITHRGIRDNGKVGTDSWAEIYADVSGYPDGDYEVRIFNRSRGIHDLTESSIDQGLLTLRKNIYITPGEHLENGRKWRTTCEAYSQTQRCRTQIWSTQVVYDNGKLVKNTGWHFNNLTYKEAPRSLWEGNPLGNKGEYTINGRQWRTDCDSKVTGGNGCRSYIISDVVEATKKGHGYTYAMVRKEVFNNIVLFENS